MESEEELAEFLGRSDQQTTETVRRCGWMIQFVGGQGREPSFGYTVGLHGLGHPELVIFGLPPSDTAGVLNNLGERVRGGQNLAEGDLVRFPDWPHRLHVLPLVNPAEVLFVANRFYRRPDSLSVPGLQLVWDDKEGRFPWEPDFAAPRWLQPLPGTFRA